MARKEYFLIDHNSIGEGFTPEEIEKYFKYFNLKGKPTGKADEMGDEFDIEGSDEDLKNLDIDLEAMTGDDYVLPWERDNTPDDPDESSEKPHDKGLASETTPEEDFMLRVAEGKVPATSSVLAGDLTPEEIEMVQMMRAGKQPSKSTELAGETTPEEKEMLNITNRLAKNLSKHRW